MSFEAGQKPGGAALAEGGVQGFDGLIVVHADGANLREYGRQAGVIIEARLVDLNDFKRSAEKSAHDEAGLVRDAGLHHHIQKSGVLALGEPERVAVCFVCGRTVAAFGWFYHRLKFR